MNKRNAVVTETTWRDVDRTPYRMLVIQYEDGSGDMVKIPIQKPLISGVVGETDK